MKTIWGKIVDVTVAVGGGIASVLGGWDWILTVLIAFMISDYLSGIIVAAMGKSQKSETGGLSSKVGVQGIARKGLMLFVVLCAALLDRVVSGDGTMIRDAVCWFYIANEGISLMENLSLAGVKFPKILQRLFDAKLEEDESSGDDQE